MSNGIRQDHAGRYYREERSPETGELERYEVPAPALTARTQREVDRILAGDPYHQVQSREEQST